MAGNQYPPEARGGVRPGYDAEAWAGDWSDVDVGRGAYSGPGGRGNGYPPMTYAYGGPPSTPGTQSRRHQQPPQAHRGHQHQQQSQRHPPQRRHPPEMEQRHGRGGGASPWAGRERAASFEGRIPIHTSHREDEDDDDEEGFYYSPYSAPQPAFFQPHRPTAAHAFREPVWDSSDELEDNFEDDFEEDWEYEEDDEEYEAEVRANERRERQQGRGGMPPMRGQPPQHHPHPHHHRPRRMSSPPDLESPPDSPPPLGGPNMMPGGGRDGRGRGRGDPVRMMRSPGGGVRIMSSVGSDVRMLPGARGGPPPLGRGMPMPMERGHGPKRRGHGRGGSSSSSYSSGDGWGGFRVQHGTAMPASMLRRNSTPGGGIKKAMRWLTKPLGTPTTLHPLLRTPSLLRTPALTWDVGHPPHALRAGVPIGMAVIGFAEPATSPPIAHMRILVPIPGLDGAHWNTDVWPTGSPYTSSRAVPPSPSFSFTGSPSAFARTLSSSPYRLGMHAPVVRSGDVLQALYTLLQRGASETDFMALDPARRDRVSKAFYVRCRVLGAAAAAAGSGREEEETGREIQRGVKRIDFMEGKTRWEGLDVGEMDEWIVRLARAA